MDDKKLNVEDTPLMLVRQYNKRWPDCYAMYKKFSPEYRKHIDVDAIHFMFSWLLSQNYRTSESIANQYATPLAATYLWKQYKVMYRFDRTLTDALYEQSSSMDNSDSIPLEILANMPFPCVYIQLDGFGWITEAGNRVDGFFSCIQPEPEDDRKCLCFVVCTVGMNEVTHYCLPLVGRTLGECLAEFSTHNSILRSDGTEYSEEELSFTKHKIEIQLKLCLQMLLYLLSFNRDEEEDALQKQENKKMRRRNKNWRSINRAEAIEVYKIGARVGAELRRAKAESGESTGHTGAKVPTHFRRGHWHHYWVGKLNSPERRLILKWLSPMLINKPKDGSDPEIPVVLHDVEGFIKEDI